MILTIRIFWSNLRVNIACSPVSSLLGIPTEQRKNEGCLQSLETVISPVEVKSNMAGQCLWRLTAWRNTAARHPQCTVTVNTSQEKGWLPSLIERLSEGACCQSCCQLHTDRLCQPISIISKPSQSCEHRALSEVCRSNLNVSSFVLLLHVILQTFLKIKLSNYVFHFCYANYMYMYTINMAFQFTR